MSFSGSYCCVFRWKTNRVLKSVHCKNLRLFGIMLLSHPEQVHDREIISPCRRLCILDVKLNLIKRWNVSEMRVCMCRYMCQDDRLWPLCSLVVFHFVCIWGSCEAAASESTTSASFNKQSLFTSAILNQTKSVIKRHIQEVIYLSASLSLCAARCLFFSVFSVLLTFIFFWSEMRTIFCIVASLIWLEQTLINIMSW